MNKDPAARQVAFLLEYINWLCRPADQENEPAPQWRAEEVKAGKPSGDF